MQHYAAFHLGLHCLPSNRLDVSGPQRVILSPSIEISGICMSTCLFIPSFYCLFILHSNHVNIHSVSNRICLLASSW